MYSIRKTAIAISLVVFHASSATAGLFTGLGDLPGGSVSSVGLGLGGEYVVGGSSSTLTPLRNEAYLWSAAGGMVGLGIPSYGGAEQSSASGVSTNGAVVIGWGNWNFGNAGYQASRWTSGTGWEYLGDLAGGSSTSQSRGVSADGSVIVGYGNSTNGPEAFRWTSGTGMVGLGDLAGGTEMSEATAVSSDGSVVVGMANGSSVNMSAGTEAFRWTSGTGMVGLGDLAGGSFLSVANAVSADGSVVVGRSESTSGTEAFRWEAGTMVGLGDLAGGAFISQANGVSADGSTIVGYGFGTSGQEAFIWDPLNNMRSLYSVLTNDYGLDLTGWSSLTSATAISADGLRVTGWGIHNGNTEAFVADLNAVPEPSSFVLMAVAAGGAWYRRRVNAGRAKSPAVPLADSE